MLALTFTKPIVIGTINGAAIGLVAIGLVLIYKSSRVFNFAAGEFVTMGAFGTYLGVNVLHFPYAVGMLMGVATGTFTGIATERFVVRPLANRPKVTILVATAAIAILLIPMELMIGGQKPFRINPAIRGVGPAILGIRVSPQQGLILFALAAAGIGLAYFFGRTDTGLAVLATSQETTASRLVGIPLNRIALLTWGAAGLLGGIAGVLLPPLSSLRAGFGTTDVLISAFTAAVLGGMTSVPGAFVGSLLVGVVSAMAQFNISSSTLPGPDSVAILVVLVAVLAIRPTGLLGKEA